ncbi:ACT domain-containing protein, partial [Chloroflexota bacterium]
ASNMLTQIAHCCHPVPGDKIIGYVTRTRGVTIHRENCYNIIHEDEKDRLIPAEWGQTDSVYPVNVQVDAWDRVGLVRDITTIVANEKVNIAGISFNNHDDDTTSTFLALETKGLTQLSQLLARIEGIRGVISVSRVRDGTPIKASHPA